MHVADGRSVVCAAKADGGDGPCAHGVARAKSLCASNNPAFFDPPRRFESKPRCSQLLFIAISCANYVVLLTRKRYHGATINPSRASTSQRLDDATKHQLGGAK